MSANTEQRKLAAIMFTDLVGYTARLQHNETLALESVPQGRPIIAQRFIAGGRGEAEQVPQGRKKLVCAERLAGAVLPPLWGLVSFCALPYCLSSSGLA